MDFSFNYETSSINEFISESDNDFINDNEEVINDLSINLNNESNTNSSADLYNNPSFKLNNK
jgi:hypothetical protein